MPVTGMAAIGKTWLAREFIRRHNSLFEAVYELDCQSKNLPALVADLASQVGLRMESEAEQAAAELRQYLSRKRCLLLLDNVEDGQPGQLVPEGRASVLATSRETVIPFLAEHDELKPGIFTESEALSLFRSKLGSVDEAAARDLFRKLGYLPVALAVAAGLIEKDVHYTVKSLAEKLPPAEQTRARTKPCRRSARVRHRLSRRGRANAAQSDGSLRAIGSAPGVRGEGGRLRRIKGIGPLTRPVRAVPGGGVGSRNAPLVAGEYQRGSRPPGLAAGILWQPGAHPPGLGTARPSPAASRLRLIRRLTLKADPEPSVAPAHQPSHNPPASSSNSAFTVSFSTTST